MSESNSWGMLNCRATPDVATQPDVALTDWRILLDENGIAYLVGLLPGGSKLRFTSSVAHVVASERVVITQSGRRYWLEGGPATSWSVLEQIQARGLVDGVVDSDEATRELWQALQQASH